jgi:hypothetical protein
MTDSVFYYEQRSGGPQGFTHAILYKGVVVSWANELFADIIVHHLNGYPELLQEKNRLLMDCSALLKETLGEDSLWHLKSTPAKNERPF